MKSIADAWCIQIEVNNVCAGRCAYCTRFNKHLRPNKRYSMTAEQVGSIFDSLDQQGYKGYVGYIGGEPTISPHFRDLVEVGHEKWRSKGRWLGLWTSGGSKYEEDKAMIVNNFSYVAYNDHRHPSCFHQPMTVASSDIVPDEAFRDELINQCWVQRIWCPTINPKGAFFCECAAAWDLILEGPGGWDLSEPWLSYGPDEYEKQKWCCQLCGMPVPMERDPALAPTEKITSSTLCALLEKGAVNMDGMRLVTDYVDRSVYEERVGNWEPGQYAPGRDPGGNQA